MNELLDSRLQTSLVRRLDYLDSCLGSDEADAAWPVGAVPSAWRDFADARHLAGYYARILACVRDPVEIERRPGLRRVGVLGQAVFEIDANGLLTPYLWCWLGDRAGCAEEFPERISVGGTPHGWTWLDRFRDGFAIEVALRTGRPFDEVAAYSRWAFGRFRRRIGRECDLGAMRDRIHAALALDPLALQVARRIRLACGGLTVATVREYNHAIAHLAAYRKLQKEAPNLVPLYAAHADRLDGAPGAEPARQLKRLVVGEHGVRESTWALAHRIRPRWLYSISEFHDGDVAEASLDLLRLLQVLGFRKAPPAWYWRDLLQIFGNEARRRCDYARRHGGHALATQRLTRLVEDAGAEELRDMREHIYDVLAWIVEDDAQRLRGVTRARWPWFRRRAAEWRAHQARQAAASGSAWPVPFERIERRGHAVVVLRSDLELIEEGRAMRHCIDTFAARCASGEHLVLSVRRPGRARPLATAWLKHAKGWRLQQIQGAANSRPRPLAVQLALEATAAINAADWLSPLAKAPRSAAGGGEDELPDPILALIARPDAVPEQEDHP